MTCNYKLLLAITIVELVLHSCNPRKASKENKVVSDSINIYNQNADILSDSNFTFLHLDSINEDMLRTDTGNYNEYIRSIKPFKAEHCQFFHTGCSDSFWDNHVFLVSKQKSINGITPVIIHDSRDFNYYHCELFTLVRNNQKIDSLIVSLKGYDRDGEIDYMTIEERKSVFKNDTIVTSDLQYKKFDNDSVVVTESSITFRRIRSDGVIEVLKN